MNVTKYPAEWVKAVAPSTPASTASTHDKRASLSNVSRSMKTMLSKEVYRWHRGDSHSGKTHINLLRVWRSTATEWVANWAGAETRNPPHKPPYPVRTPPESAPNHAGRRRTPPHNRHRKQFGCAAPTLEHARPIACRRIGRPTVRRRR